MGEPFIGDLESSSVDPLLSGLDLNAWLTSLNELFNITLNRGPIVFPGYPSKSSFDARVVHRVQGGHQVLPRRQRHVWSGV